MKTLPGVVHPQVLLYNFKPDARSLRIAHYLSDSGVSVRQVQPSELAQPLGVLFSLPGFEPVNAPAFGAAFQEEMLVMCGFHQARLDEFLRFFRREQLRRVELKAVLTPTNAAWNGAQLCRHLLRERDAMQRR